jgi:hypothetical protein
MTPSLPSSSSLTNGRYYDTGCVGVVQQPHPALFETLIEHAVSSLDNLQVYMKTGSGDKFHFHRKAVLQSVCQAEATWPDLPRDDVSDSYYTVMPDQAASSQ